MDLVESGTKVNVKVIRIICKVNEYIQWRQKVPPHPVRLNYQKISSFVNIHDIAMKLGRHMYRAMSYMPR